MSDRKAEATYHGSRALARIGAYAEAERRYPNDLNAQAAFTKGWDHRDAAPGGQRRTPPPGETGIEAYPVGLFLDLRTLRGRLRHPQGWMTRGRALRLFVRRFTHTWMHRGYWNGYLAEWHYCPEGVRHTRCGKGWTRRAALRRLGAHIVEMNRLDACR